MEESSEQILEEKSLDENIEEKDDKPQSSVSANKEVKDEIEKLEEEDTISRAKEKLVEKVLSYKKTTPFPKRFPGEYKTHDDKAIKSTKMVDHRKRFAPKTILEKAEEEKMGIERRLEESDKQLSELIQLGNELVTNIQVANEKREVARRNLEAVKREDLLNSLENEEVDCARLSEKIAEKWNQIKAIKEPMGLYEEMENQKKRIEDLMKEKDNFIQKCQDEIKRVNERYYEDLEKQGADIYCLVERIDKQLELMKNAYSDHLELLQRTIEKERENLALTAVRKWEGMFHNRIDDETKKIDIEKEKAKFYAEEIERIALEHEEITMATKIRLEKDAENLQLELRTVKNNVLLNSEKLDYNYQVLQKRDDENVIIRNQQKRRLAKINETISTLKKKIKTLKANSEAEMKKLTGEVLHLHSSIVELEAKSKNFNVMNDKKYQSVWDINYQEVLSLLNKVFDIDKILHEQQLGLDWVRPNVPFIKMKDLPLYKNYSKQIKLNSPSVRFDAKTKSSKTSLKQISGAKTDEQKLADTRLLRNILQKISDRAGFLLESNLVTILQPYTEEQKNLVRIDNIFAALQITSMDEVSSLIQYFLPYAWCPNCSKSSAINVLGKVYHLDIEQSFQSKSNTFSTDATSYSSHWKDMSLSKTSVETPSTSELSSSESEHNIETLLNREKEKKKLVEVKKSVQFDVISHTTLNPDCPNHYLVIEPVLVLTAIREFVENHFCSNLFSFNEGMKTLEVAFKKPTTLSRAMNKQDVAAFWSQFSGAISDQKQKLWKSLEHGLNHYLKVLKDRESLDTQCEFLRKQNSELKHLLQKYVPKSCKQDDTM